MSQDNRFPQNGIYMSKVFHERHMPFNHKLNYRVFAFFVDLDELDDLSRNVKWFSLNKFNLTSIYFKDHASRDGSAIKPWVMEAAKEKGIDLNGGKIFMLCFPRMYGYVFNPLTIYYCYTKDATLAGILYQVKNTFGEQHGYFLPVEETEPKIAQETQKVFHVSPFIQMDCTYKFRLEKPSNDLSVNIHQFTDEGKILTATWHGTRRAFQASEIVKAVLKHPLMTFKVIAGIHWEALKLVIKGAKYIRKPEPPETEVS